MTTTGVLAILGACTGTLALIWDIFKWRHDGVHLAVEAITFGFDEPEGFTLTINNRGGKPTTLTEVWLTYPNKDRLAKHFRLLDSAQRLFVTKPNIKFELPNLIQPGEMRTVKICFGQDIDEEEFPSLIAKRQLYVVVKSSHSSRGQRILVTPGKLFPCS